MPVIGRLDGQVEEVIINPIGRRPAREGDDAATATRPATQGSEETTPHEPLEQRRDERREADELPVWLL